MTDEDDGFLWQPALFQEASEQAIEQQQQFLRQMMSGGATGLEMNQIGSMSQFANFKTRVQRGSRISIPDAECEALDIGEGDLIQAAVLTVTQKQ